MDYNKLNYSECVKKGKFLIESLQSTKYEICLITSRVCDIRIGGHGKGKAIYSMKKFANDIGMSAETLRKWMGEHRNVVEKLPHKPKKEDYKVIREVMKGVNNKTPQKKVVQLFDKFSKYSKEDHALLRLIKDAKGIRNFTSDMALSKLIKSDLDLLEVLLSESLDNIKKRKVKTILKKAH